MKRLLLILTLIGPSIFAQNTGVFEDPILDQVIKGQYDPSTYADPNPITAPSVILQGIGSRIEPDSLFSYLEDLDDFETRNTASDTLSAVRGIGAARKYILSKFEDFSGRENNRLLTGFFRFDLNICGMGRHKNVVAILPGTDTANHQVVIIEGHYDSRCETSCDTSCVAHGMEDNGSGTALVMELARVMSHYTYPYTIVFMATTAEEQGLYGAYAFSGYCQTNNIPVKAVLNNDVIGGIICGKTSSPPSCPGEDDIDSTQVRLFSRGGFNSPNKALCRFIKLEYQEELLPYSNVPMTLSLMTGEDRIGRGGDHIPFRVRGYPAMRFTSANEHGDAGIGPNYTDRQHTTDDVLGVDTDNDNVIDSFYVDRNYLARNCAINGVAAGVLALGPDQPTFSVAPDWNGIKVTVTDPMNYGTYRLGIRTTDLDFDTIITFSGSTAVLDPGVGGEVFFSLCAVDQNGLESLFDEELALYNLGLEDQGSMVPTRVELLQNYPNPFDDATIISFTSPNARPGDTAEIRITDLNGKLIKTLPVPIERGMNEVVYQHGYGVQGTFLYSLYIQGELISTKRMVFAY